MLVLTRVLLLLLLTVVVMMMMVMVMLLLLLLILTWRGGLLPRSVVIVSGRKRLDLRDRTRPAQHRSEVGPWYRRGSSLIQTGIDGSDRRALRVVGHVWVVLLLLLWRLVRRHLWAWIHLRAVYAPGTILQLAAIWRLGRSHGLDLRRSERSL